MGLRKAGANWVEGDRFYNRESELEALTERMGEGIHTLLTAQRRMGKTSLVRELLRRLKQEGGPARMNELIQGSPAMSLLLPLTTALEQELGLTPRVAQEVNEVAQDIRRELKEIRDAKGRGDVV